MEDFKLNTIEEAIADFREGKFIIVVDLSLIHISEPTRP